MIDCIRAWLARAEAGDVLAVGVCAVTDADGTTSTEYIGGTGGHRKLLHYAATTLTARILGDVERT